MSRIIFRAFMIGALALVASRQAIAAPVLLLSSPDNLSQLGVGDVIRIDVSLSGLQSPPAPADEILALYSEVLFSSSLFDPVTGPTPGAVVPLAEQQANFTALSSLSDGSALGIFNQFLSPTTVSSIGLNGVYFSFTLRATAAGTGSIAFDPGDSRYVSGSTGFGFALISLGGPLAFSVSSDTPPTSVPEPASTLLLGAGLLGAGVRCWRQKRA